ncbi:cysteine-rich venom [Lasius niger]|uniref:Cysteine-rich venom n=1 Tax=Lasius niger TaxID=67767 RepID=A0A0J7KB30_LASNI|nr:cysteine-rich venom [Lasius niger]
MDVRQRLLIIVVNAELQESFAYLIPCTNAVFSNHIAQVIFMRATDLGIEIAHDYYDFTVSSVPGDYVRLHTINATPHCFDFPIRRNKPGSQECRNAHYHAICNSPRTFQDAIRVPSLVADFSCGVQRSTATCPVSDFTLPTPDVEQRQASTGSPDNIPPLYTNIPFMFSWEYKAVGSRVFLHRSIPADIVNYAWRYLQ